MQQHKLLIGTMVPSSPSPSLLLLRSTKIYLSILFLSRSRSLQIYSGLFFPLNRTKKTMMAAPTTGSCPYMSFSPDSLRGI
jgi:hypothetical protein